MTTTRHSRASQEPAILLSAGPADFADVQRSLTFLERVDELIWKRSVFGQFEFNHRGRSGIASLEFHSHDGCTVRRRELSPVAGNSGGSPVQGLGSVHKMNVFDETNIKALEERLILWESAVRSRPCR